MLKNIKIHILSDNHAGTDYLAEHGLSYYIEYEKNILFDAGQSDVFLKNAKKLGLDINNRDCTVLSHGHFDHGNGLEYISGKNLISHPDAFIKRYRRRSETNIGLSQDKNTLNQKFDLRTSKIPFNISDNIIFLGEIPRLNSFEAKKTYFKKEDGSEDFVIDDSAIVIIKDNFLIVITGCGHAGICNTVGYAQKITGIRKVKAVMGGFHLKEDNDVTKSVIKNLKENEVENILPSHCTELPALAAFYNEFEIKPVKTGMLFVF